MSKIKILSVGHGWNPKGVDPALWNLPNGNSLPPRLKKLYDDLHKKYRTNGVDPDLWDLKDPSGLPPSVRKVYDEKVAPYRGTQNYQDWQDTLSEPYPESKPNLDINNINSNISYGSLGLLQSPQGEGQKYYPAYKGENLMPGYDIIPQPKKPFNMMDHRMANSADVKTNRPITSKATITQPVVNSSMSDSQFMPMEPLNLKEDNINVEPIEPTNPTSKSYNPTLSPLGHILSGVGALADYRALRGAKPEPIDMPRMGAEQVSYAQQRLANTRGAADARSINLGNARRLGINAGSMFANASAANTGVNKLLGQQQAELSMNENNKNAELRQQAALANLQTGAQGELENNRMQNEYRMLLAGRNPLGALSRTAASYFKDNAAYQQQFNTLRMQSPNADIYQPEDQNWFDRFLGQGPGVRFKGNKI